MSKTKLASDLRTILFSKKVSDVILKTSDGVELPALRSILSCRSKVFMKMFYEEFIESQSRVVELNFESEIVRTLVAYCYTADLKISDINLEPIMDDEDFEAMEQKINNEFICKIIHITEAANYFGIESLEETLKDCTREIFKHIPWLACQAFEVCHADNRDSRVIKFFRKTSKENIRMNPTASLLPSDDNNSKGVLSLSATALGEILKERNLNADEYNIFCYLKKWAKYDTFVRDENNEPSKRKKSDSREEDAKILAKHIILSRIAPSKLVKVSECEFIEQESLNRAYREHALVLERKRSRDNYMKLLKLPRSKFFSGVRVEHAGVSAVNGLYEYRGLHRGVASYEKEALWNGENETFCIYKKSSNYWYISIVKGIVPGEGEDIDLYKANEIFEDNGNLPEDMWEGVIGEDGPLPGCTLVNE